MRHNGNDNTLPVRKENNCFYAQKFRKWLMFGQYMFDGFIKQDQKVECYCERYVINNGNLKVTSINRELSIIVVPKKGK